MSAINSYEMGVWFGVVFFVTCCFSSPFFHNGMLYTTRNNLNPKIYKKRWFADKEKSEPTKDDANIEIEAGFRIGMFVVSLVFLIGLILEIINA
jgi:hypothetical protein